MLGAIIGDIVGSIYEGHNIKTKDFTLFGEGANYTDDSILTLATADWLLHGGEVASYYARYATTCVCPRGGYGGMFSRWAAQSVESVAAPYDSCGNGSAMRVSPVGWISADKGEVLARAAESAACTHNHPEGVKGAQATALCILMARCGSGTEGIREAIEREFGYDLSASVAYLQAHYSWRGIDGGGYSALCQDSVPQAIICALEATDFEDAIRSAISIGGYSDTIGYITGGIAEALLGIPQDIGDKGMNYLPTMFQDIVRKFEERYPSRPCSI